jgi:osmotically inducible protein OsmC
MTELDKVLYAAKVHTTSGREGAARSGDGRLDIELSPPGIPGNVTNPEQLFAAVAGKRKVMLPAGTAIDAAVDLRIAEGTYFLKARFNVSLQGLAHEVAQAPVDQAHQTRPYFKAHAATSMSRSTLSIPN